MWCRPGTRPGARSRHATASVGLTRLFREVARCRATSFSIRPRLLREAVYLRIRGPITSLIENRRAHTPISKMISEIFAHAATVAASASKCELASGFYFGILWPLSQKAEGRANSSRSGSMAVSTQSHVQEDTWISASCGQCYCMCGVRAHRQNGVITEMAGNPDAPTGHRRVPRRRVFVGQQVPHRVGQSGSAHV